MNYSHEPLRKGYKLRVNPVGMAKDWVRVSPPMISKRCNATASVLRGKIYVRNRLPLFIILLIVGVRYLKTPLTLSSMSIVCMIDLGKSLHLQGANYTLAMCRREWLERPLSGVLKVLKVLYEGPGLPSLVHLERERFCLLECTLADYLHCVYGN
ncbi:hypothetical protein FH972_005106 [Carpinus fangiana]|uniref:Uncharacterized protein n=1 Tax=Carpinus fangiana TaxID=176857 RepID=A0A5N6QN83_9ROSI|nr:hypothetical protein FH972_005106 [Carpinus fangiana]